MEECCTEDTDRWFSATLSLTYNYICRSVTYILCNSDSALYFEYYLMNKPHSLDIGSDMGHWPVFHDLAILNHLPISAYSGSLEFDMKIFVNAARLEIGQLFTQGTRWDIRVLWTHFKFQCKNEFYFTKWTPKAIFSRVATPQVKIQLLVFMSEMAGCSSSIESASEFDPHVRHSLSWRLGHEKKSTAILPLPLIQEEQLSVTGERMCTKYW